MGLTEHNLVNEIQECKDQIRQNEIRIDQLMRILGGFQKKLMQLESFISGQPFARSDKDKEDLQ